MIASRSRARLLDGGLLARHQIAALLATAVDFMTMFLLVEVAGLSPPPATMVSAMFGALANFTASRVWAYRNRHDERLFAQAARYALVASGGAILNASLLATVLSAVHVPYGLARAAVALGVSVLYTYPLHTRVVFKVAS